MAEIKSISEVIARLQYKADNIKAKLDPSYFTECVDFLKAAEPKKGKWIDWADPSESKRHRHYPVCSVCDGHVMEFIAGSEDWWVYSMPNYCPNCGADMRGAEND